MCDAVFVTCCSEGMEEWMRLEWFGFELGMELTTEGVGVTGYLGYLNLGCVGCGAGKAQASAGEHSFVLAVELIAMAVTFADLGCAIGLGCERVRLHHTGPCAETHRPTHLFYTRKLAEFVDDPMRCGRVELA